MMTSSAKQVSTETTRNQVLRISLSGDLKSDQIGEFRRSYELDQRFQRYELDFSRVRYIDSSMLGMLLVMRQYLGGNRASICLLNVPDSVRKVLSICHFERYFDY